MTSKKPGQILRLCKRQRWRCHYCNRRMHSKPGHAGEATVDHITPRVHGGASLVAPQWGFPKRKRNRVAACRRCNEAKGSKPEWLFLQELRKELVE